MCRPRTPGALTEGVPVLSCQQALVDLWLTWRAPWRECLPQIEGLCEQPELPGGGLGPGVQGGPESQGGLPHVRAPSR